MMLHCRLVNIVRRFCPADVIRTQSVSGLYRIATVVAVLLPLKYWRCSNREGSYGDRTVLLGMRTIPRWV